jgi:hypothetical protein
MMEPFLVNPPIRRRKKAATKRRRKAVNPPRGRSIVVYNPRRKSRKSVKRRKPIRASNPEINRPSRRGGVKTMKHRKSRKRRRNPVVLGSNPRRRRNYRRNPGLPGLKAFPLPSFKKFMGLGIGAVSAGLIVPQVFKMVPFLSGNAFGRIAARLGVVALIGFAVKKIGPLKAQADNIIDGATVTQIFPIVNDVAAFAKLPIRLGQDEEGEMALGYFTEDMEMGQPEIGQPEIGLYTDEVESALQVG